MRTRLADRRLFNGNQWRDVISVRVNRDFVVVDTLSGRSVVMTVSDLARRLRGTHIRLLYQSALDTRRANFKNLKPRETRLQSRDSRDARLITSR